jgi:hypothetical protein
VEEFSQQSSTSGFQRQASAKGGVDIDEVDADGKFIKLKNTTSKVMIVIIFYTVLIDKTNKGRPRGGQQVWTWN